MYYCENCKNEFDEPVQQYVTTESYYGVDSLLDERIVKLVQLCPHCGSEEIEEMGTCDNCGYPCRDIDLTDTEELFGGGVGNLCPDCMRDLRG